MLVVILNEVKNLSKICYKFVMRMKRVYVILLIFYCFPLWGQEHALTGGNRLRVIRSGNEFISSLVADISSARESVDMEYYWFSTDSAGRVVRDALAAKAREGIRVRVLFDNLITPSAPAAYYDVLRKAGAEVRVVHDFEKMGPFQSVGAIFSMRDHRKIAVIDNCIGYTGGMNLCMESVQWNDTQVRVEGPAAAVLLSTLYPDSVIPSADGPVQVQVITSEKGASAEALYVRALREAREYFYIQTPYFCPPESILAEMKAASARGVDVRLLLPERCDWGFMNELSRDYFEQLLAAGIPVFLFTKKYDHTKAFVSDGNITCIGSINLDKRSFHINKEAALFIYDAPFAREYTLHFLDLQEQSYQVQPGESVARGIHKPYRAFLRFLDPLF